MKLTCRIFGHKPASLFSIQHTLASQYKMTDAAVLVARCRECDEQYYFGYVSLDIRPVYSIKNLMPKA
jgi:hypothetical protein